MFEIFADGLLLLLGMALGWALSRQRAAPLSDVAGNNRAEILVDLARAAGDDPDMAVEALVRAARIEPQAVDLQLNLGSLFRKRGETDRAIRVHEAVLAHSQLAPAEFNAAQLELARDYLKAGLLDRTEALLLPLTAAGSSAPALELLLELHEQSQGWTAAIDAAQRWQSVSGSSAGKRIAQYRCALADAARERGDAAEAERLANMARDDDRACVRANLLLGGLMEARKDWSGAIDAYLRAIEQDPRFASEVIDALRRCYAAAADPAGYARFLEDARAALSGSAAITGARAHWLLEHQQDPRAYLAQQLATHPTREILLLWLEAHPELGDDSTGLRSALQRSIKSRPRYLCSSCGLQPSLLFWQCPNCRNWGTVGPREETL